jgi:rhodanese-related sulfurtransferase
MPNPYGAPEISAQEMNQKRQAGEAIVWLDVREPWETRKVQVHDESVVNVPLQEIAERRLEALPEVALDKDAEIVVQCHHGMRSAQVTAWLIQQGWTNVRSLAGGVAAWADEVDPTIGKY